ncbi:MAG TPA: amidohydrolase family protein [Candidatus Limnocylindria bacterium]|nr:amidohydrolase family protein [Candidatus Limnocylindria bacterium]
MHCAGTRDEVEWIRQIEVLSSANALGPDLLLAHCNLVTAGERELLASHVVHVSMNPLNEVRYALAAPQLSELLDAGVSTSFSIDSTAVLPASPFETMRTAYGLERVRTGRIIAPRTLLGIATLGGARALGLADRVGSLRKGKRADVVLLRMDGPGMVGTGDPAERIVHCAQPLDVETVIVDGRVVKVERRRRPGTRARAGWPVEGGHREAGCHRRALMAAARRWRRGALCRRFLVFWYTVSPEPDPPESGGERWER